MQGWTTRRSVFRERYGHLFSAGIPVGILFSQCYEMAASNARERRKFGTCVSGCRVRLIALLFLTIVWFARELGRLYHQPLRSGYFILEPIELGPRLSSQ